MKFPVDVRKSLASRFRGKHREWLAQSADALREQEGAWPLEVGLGAPTENQAIRQLEAVRTWVATWQSWRGAGTIVWSDRRWRVLGTQRVPVKLALAGPGEVAQWIGEAARWERARGRYADLVSRWPGLSGKLVRHFDLLADYGDADYRRLVDLVAWLEANPGSGMYPRQLPVAGIDSKWIEGRRTVVAEMVDAIRGNSPDEGDFYRRCGLQAPPQMIRLRILDCDLRARVGGLADIAAPWCQLAKLDIPAEHIFIVENLQTGLSFGELPGSVVIMQLGYGVDVLGRLPWVAGGHCIYWGDLDTHGFAILHRARSHLPGLESVLMDRHTLHRHRSLWVVEKSQHGAESLPHLSESEAEVYQAIKRNDWGRNVRLEQERIAWDFAWSALRQATRAG